MKRLVVVIAGLIAVAGCASDYSEPELPLEHAANPSGAASPLPGPGALGGEGEPGAESVPAEQDGASGGHGGHGGHPAHAREERP
jgi:hypothetical protein